MPMLRATTSSQAPPSQRTKAWARPDGQKGAIEPRTLIGPKPGDDPDLWCRRWVRCDPSSLQQRTRFAASPASLVSLYFADMSRPVSARVLMVVSRSTRCLDAISLVAMRKAVHALIDMEAARIKGIKSEVAGRAQILVVPDLEAGNMLAKNLAYLAKADSAGIVLGARVPIVLTSRADSPRARMASCAVAALYADARRRRAPAAAV